MSQDTRLDPCVKELPGWVEPADLLARAARRRRPALLCSGAAGRFSILAADPYMTLAWTAGRGVVEGPDGREVIQEADPFTLTAGLAGRSRSRPAGPWPFAGGAIGSIAYDAGRALESLPERAVADRPFPWLDLAFYSRAICWDHLRRRWAALATGAPLGGAEAARQCDQEAAWALGEPSGLPDLPGPVWGPEEAWRGGRATAGGEMGRKAYMAGVDRIRRHILEGDCYQVNLTRRIRAGEAADPVRLFRELLRANPAPFAAWIHGSEGFLVGSSPERFLRVGGGRAESCPIKGTIRRPPEREADREAARRLRESAKDRAENVMIVDLVRNDLGRVSRPGTVRVDSLCRVESFPGVHHLVSTVSGDLEEGAGPLDAARALFPPGSMTGAPKVRAMEIIEELEPVRRGPYAGAAGYLSSSGEMDLSVVIRSFLLSKGAVDLHVGGGIVADSDPEAEFEESALKAERALRALRVAEG